MEYYYVYLQCFINPLYADICGARKSPVHGKHKDKNWSSRLEKSKLPSVVFV